jgi:FkbM family methyltransferase
MQTVKAGGFTWFVPDFAFKNLPTEDWERKERDWILKNIPKGGLFVDVGANLGIYAITLAEHFEEVIAIEPQPLNVEILKKNIELNGIDNIVVLQKGAWDETKLLKVYQVYEGDMASASFVSDSEKGIDDWLCQKPINEIVIDAIKVDDLHLNPDFIKIDIEGGEARAIKGMMDTINRCRPSFFIEMHTQAKAREICEMLKDKYDFGMAGDWPGQQTDKWFFQPKVQ